MHNAWKWIRFVLTLAVLALSTPGMAQPAKIYSLNMSPTPLPMGGVGVIVTATFKNEVPNGNSSFNSLQLVAPAGVSIPNQTIATPSGSATVVGGNTIRIQNISPVKPQKTFVFSFTVNVTATTCTAGSWGPTTFTGSNFSGETFALQPAPLSNIAALVGCDISLACYPSTPYVEGTTTITRDLDNPDKLPPVCKDVAFNVVFSDLDRLVFIQWDENVAPEVILKSETKWPTEELSAAQWPKRTRVAWLLDNTSAPALIDAPACLGSGTDQPGLVGVNEVFPTLTSPPAPYTNGERARACIYSETFEVQPISACPSAANGCIKVITKMWISGDPWLSRQ